MTYQLGIDLGTTYTAAAIADGGTIEALNLGTRSAVLPTVVFARDDGDLLVGETAETRGVREPTRVARDFKRRLGDTAPLVLGGVPYPVEALMAAVLAHVRQAAAERMGAEPDHVVITHPATYSNYRLDLLRDAVRRSGLTSVEFLTEPQAAATHYASLDRVAVGDVIAVYDLGGGTFDAAIVRNTPDGFELLGQPQGLERLGGIDFDVAVLEHVNDSLGSQLEALDDADPAVRAGLARLRADARHAKETLSNDTDTTIPLIVPGVVGEVALSRAELERLVIPRIRESIDVLRRALTSAHLEPTDLASVLLVGGSSRIPAVRRMVTEALHVRVTADVDPEMAVALGAARHAVGQAAPAAPSPVAPPPLSTPPSGFVPPPPAPTGPGRSKRLPVIGAVVAAAVVAVVAVVALTSGGSEPRSQPDGTDAPDDTSSGIVTGEACDRFIALVADATTSDQALRDEGASGCDLSGIDLSSRALMGIDFSRATLDGAKFDDSDVSGALFLDASLTGTSFLRSTMQATDFSGANLTGIIVEESTAPYAVFDSVTMRGASFVHSDCTGCSFDGAVLVGSDVAGTNFSGANIANADFASVGIEGIEVDASTKFGPAPGPILLVIAGTGAGSPEAAAAALASVGYETLTSGDSLSLQSSTSVSCRGDFFGSEMRKLLIALDHFFLGDVQEVDFNEIESAVTITDEQVACVVLLGADLVPA